MWWIRITSAIQGGRPRRISDRRIWRVQLVPARSPGCLHTLVLLAVLQKTCSFPAHPLPSPCSFLLFVPRSDTGAPNACSRPSAFAFPLGTGHFLPRSFASHLISASANCLGLLALSPTVPCTEYLHEIFASPPALAIVFGNGYDIMSNSAAQSQIPTKTTVQRVQRLMLRLAWGKGLLWCHTGGGDTREDQEQGKTKAALCL